MFSSTSRPNTAVSRPVTGRSRPKTSATSTGQGYLTDDVICAVAESRGVSPSNGLAVINLSTCEVVLCQFTDTQTFARTCHKLKVFDPTEILYASSAAESKFIAILHENFQVDTGEVNMTKLDRGYWSEGRGHEYIKTLALPQDYEALRRSLAGSYLAVCCFAAAMRYLDTGRGKTFAHRSVRIKFESSEGAMMMDISTIASLELVQNQQNAKSKDCLFGLLNNTQTRMGSRLLKTNILQPSTDATKIQRRWAVVEELSTKEEMFHMIREALKNFVDADKILSDLVTNDKRPNFHSADEAVNKVLLLKAFADSIQPVWQALEGASSVELQKIRDLCNVDNYVKVQKLLDYALSNDASYSQNAIDLRNQRVFAIRRDERFQIITGCKMSGKSTYIRSIALMTVMAQIGCFIPAEHGSFPIVHQLFARVATDDCLEANVSTFAAEMREMAFILRNIEPRSLVIIDELGRGTSTTDGLAIAVAIAEALVQSRAFVWFVTHFRDLPRILAERVGVYNLHMDVDMDEDFRKMKMKYKVSQGYEEQKFYGLALAQLVDLPDEILGTALQVSKALHAQNDANRSNTRTILLARKRKLAVHMKETLVQACDGPLEGPDLLDRLRTLQAEFTARMLAIESELESIQDLPVQMQHRDWASTNRDIDFDQSNFGLPRGDDRRTNPTANSDTEEAEMSPPVMASTEDSLSGAQGAGSMTDPIQL